jgi:2,4-dienoyl-CoA reductase (NADPH2)
MSPGHGYVEDNRPTDRLLAYLEERAAGGTAMIIQTICPWKRTSQDGLHPLPSCYDETCLPDLERMVEVVHRHGGLICGQPYFVHDWKPAPEEPESPWGPSDIAVLAFMGGFKAMTKSHIEDFKKMYVNAARILRDAGFDAIEVMAGVGGILSRFMARATNNRTDEYGGSLENRTHLVIEVISSIREALGPDYPIVVRWSPIDFISTPNGPGLSMEEALQIAPLFEEAGCDLHDLSIGWHETSKPLTTKVIEDCHWTSVSAQIKTVASKPVAQGYRNTNPAIMEKALQAKKVDVIAGLRYSIADPALPKKIMEDRTDDMRLCIVCCRCLDDVVSQGKPLDFCGVNPHLGPELDHEMYPRTKAQKRVVIIGSGPAGMTAALTAEQCGHVVSLYEAGPRLGGCMKMSSIFSPYHERHLNYLIRQVEKNPRIEVHLKTEATPALIKSLKPDVAIVAVGGSPQELEVPGADGKNVVSSHDFLEMLNGRAPKKRGFFNSFMWKTASLFLRLHYTPRFARNMTENFSWPIGRHVAIIGGGLPGCELAHLCMTSGRTTAIIEERKKIGFDVGGSDRFGLISGFKKAPHVEMYPLTHIDSISKDGVHASRLDKEDEDELFVPAKTVAITLGLTDNRNLGETLESIVSEVYLVGDCNEPARIADATKAGYRAACAL